METTDAGWRTVREGLLVRRGLALPLALSGFKLIAFDMDSTLIATETVDELAELAGCKPRIEAMTRAAMQGEQLDFAANLRARMQWLKGTPQALLEKVRDERMPATEGIETLLAACRHHGLRCVLISGGFTFFADAVAGRLGLDEVHANVLGMRDGVLTGEVHPQPGMAFVDAEGKRERLLGISARMGIEPRQVIAVGDGANDRPMLEAAGLAVGLHPKPALRMHADVVIERGGLDRLLEVFNPG